jgi:hypothetical protein
MNASIISLPFPKIICSQSECSQAIYSNPFNYLRQFDKFPNQYVPALTHVKLKQ